MCGFLRGCAAHRQYRGGWVIPGNPEIGTTDCTENTDGRDRGIPLEVASALSVNSVRSVASIFLRLLTAPSQDTSPSRGGRGCYGRCPCPFPSRARGDGRPGRGSRTGVRETNHPKGRGRSSSPAYRLSPALFHNSHHGSPLPNARDRRSGRAGGSELRSPAFSAPLRIPYRPAQAGNAQFGWRVVVRSSQPHSQSHFLPERESLGDGDLGAAVDSHEQSDGG